MKKERGGWGLTYQDVYLMDNLTIEAKAIYGMLCSYAGTGGTAYPSVEFICNSLQISERRFYTHMNLFGTGGTAYPSVEFICNSLQISERRFYTHMNLLIGAGIVEKQICRKNGKRSNNLYVLTPNIHFQPVENESVENLSVENVGSNNNTINNNNTNNNGKRSNNLYVLTPNIHFQPVENESVENLSVENVGSNNNTINNNNTNNNNINTICSEPEKSAPSGTGIMIPLADGTYFDVPEDKIPLWKQAYPAVNIDQELKKIIAWCDANPTKRKTRRGVTKFINSWLDRSQNQSRGTNGQQTGVRSGENKQGYIDSYI